MFIRLPLILPFLLLFITTGAAAPRPRLLLTPDSVAEIRTRAQDKTKTTFGYVPHTAWLKLRDRADHFVAAPAYRYAVNIPAKKGKGGGRWEYTLSDAPPPRHDDSKHYPPWTTIGGFN